nr:MAG TPA: hypothetical protein [Caudoviricetes sp.]
MLFYCRYKFLFYYFFTHSIPPEIHKTQLTQQFRKNPIRVYVRIHAYDTLYIIDFI